MDYFDILLAKKLNGGGGSPIDLRTLTVTENGEQDAPSGVAYNKVVTNVPAPSNALFKQTLSNLPSPIATFTGADAPLDSLKASIVGVQDLHGYDKPWAGGEGKNLLPPISFQDQTIDGMSYSTDGNGAYYIDGVNGVTQTRVDVDIEPITLPQTVYIHLNNPTVNARAVIAFADEDGVQMYYTSGSAANKILNVSADLGGKTVARISISVYGNGINVDEFSMRPMLTVSSEPTTFEPYSNICPISGWTSCEVTDNNDTYTIPFKDSSDNPIEVFSGSVDITGGDDSLNDRVVNLASNTNWNWTDIYGYRIVRTRIESTLDTGWLCSHLKQVGADDDMVDGTFRIKKYNFNNFEVRISGVTTSEEMNTWLANQSIPVRVVVPFNTAIENTFTPIALRSNGVTNISVNCGEVTELKYFSETP